MKQLSALMLAAASLATGCTTSSVLMTGGAREARNADQVTIYLRPPSEPYDSIALITATSTASTSRDGAKLKAIEELRAKAAALGANGLIVAGSDGGSGHATGVFIPGARGTPALFVGGPGIHGEAQGEAIFVKK